MLTAHYDRSLNFGILTGCIVFLLVLQLVEGRVRRKSEDGSTLAAPARPAKAAALFLRLVPVLRVAALVLMMALQWISF